MCEVNLTAHVLRIEAIIYAFFILVFEYMSKSFVPSLYVAGV